VRKKVLVIEDEKIDALRVAKVIREEFPNVGIEVVANGEQALDWIQRFRPLSGESIVLVLMDLTMPRMSGLDLISEFKANPFLKSAPVVILSGSDNPEAVKSAYASGACGYLLKQGESAGMHLLLKQAFDYWLHANLLPGS
jgi:CheY-like chemotaxis protein